MGNIGSYLGFGGGQSGTGIDKQSTANLIPTVNGQNVQDAMSGTQGSMQSQQALLQALQQQQGIQNQNQVYGQLQGVANGTGPNPAQAQYQQNVNNLAQQQAGAMASAKGISPALQARLISQQGSAAMQNAAGQGATNQAAQQMAAIGGAGQMANTMAGQQIGQTNTNAQTNLSNQGQILGAAGQNNQTVAGEQNQINSGNASMANTQMGNQYNTFSGLAGSVPFLKGFAGAEGGEVQAMPIAPSPQHQSGGGGMESMLPMLAMLSNGGQVQPQGNYLLDYFKGWTPGMAKGGMVDAVLSPGEAYLPPSSVNEVAKDGKNPLSVAQRVPGKPKVPGNSYANDVVPAELEKGGVVIPNSVMQSKNPSGDAMKFVEAILSKKKATK